MPALVMEWDEDRGGARTRFNFISVPTSSELYQATREALPWQPSGAHDGDTHMVIPSVSVEALFRKAPVPDPTQLRPEKFIEKCLSLENYIMPALSLLMEQGLFKVNGDEDDSSKRTNVWTNV